MRLSVFDIFKIGIGPSSSHTVGPMRAARRFAEALETMGRFDDVARVSVELYGSLGNTGKGHGTDVAIQLGLEGETPDETDVDAVPARIQRIATSGKLQLLGRRPVTFSVAENVVFLRRKSLPMHPNGMRFVATDASGAMVEQRTYYSVGGGFVVDEHGAAEVGGAVSLPPLPYAFRSGAELLRICKESGLSVSTLALENEKVLRPEAEVRAGVLKLVSTMRACVRRGCEREGILPGGLKVKRRAAGLHRLLRADPNPADPLSAMDWVNLWALAVNEENAAGGRVVTAPTNGAAGIIPAVLMYHERWVTGADEDSAVRFLLAAGAIGMLYKMNASISGAEVGCQGEVGVACSMAAAALAEVMGGTPAQVENAAEIGMEHNLGLTCDPIGGLVQVPCIERNAMGSVKAINAARLAMAGDGKHKVSLDKVIATMRQTGADMSTKYKETARGGLAVNIIEC
ncbi:MAG: L-serine dehydratase [Labilithrix sp.]|nr:L-serine dehydratase [Labilithrix sp.]